MCLFTCTIVSLRTPRLMLPSIGEVAAPKFSKEVRNGNLGGYVLDVQDCDDLFEESAKLMSDLII